MNGLKIKSNSTVDSVCSSGNYCCSVVQIAAGIWEQSWQGAGGGQMVEWYGSGEGLCLVGELARNLSYFWWGRLLGGRNLVRKWLGRQIFAKILQGNKNGAGVGRGTSEIEVLQG